MNTIYPLFADLDLTVVTSGNLNEAGNGIRSYDPFATTEKVIIYSGGGGEFSIHVTASIFPIATEKIAFALAVSASNFRPSITLTGPRVDCLQAPQTSGDCRDGWLECREPYAGAICNAVRSEWKQDPQQEWKLDRKEITYGYFTRVHPKNESYTGVQFTAEHNATRGVVVCISTQRFKQPAEPNVLCTTDVYGRNNSIYDPLWIEVTQTTDKLKLWTAAYCVSNSTCSFNLTWKNANQSRNGLTAEEIIAIAFGGFIVVVGAIIAACCCCFRRNKEPVAGS
jgi:hypothetical protein